MKSFILLIIAISLFASNISTKDKIIMMIMDNIYTSEQKVIYFDDKKMAEVFSKKYEIASSCENSNFIILSKKTELPNKCKEKNIFVLRYDLLYDIPQGFGAFFFKKGRANIILLKNKLKKHGIETSKELEPYLEDRVW